MTEELVKFDGDGELSTEIAESLAEDSTENLEGVTPRLPRIKMPTGQGKEFTLESLDGSEDEGVQSKEIAGVILYQTAAKAYWIAKFGSPGASPAPDCASHDGIMPSSGYGEVQATNCASCPRNRFGTAVTDDGSKGRGKACRDVKRVVIMLQDQQEIPYLLTVPPTSLRNFDDYMITLRKNKRPYWSVLTKIHIVSDRGGAGVWHPRIVLDGNQLINNKETLNKIKVWKSEWKKLIQETSFVQEETTPSSVGTPGEAADDDDIPF